jgi:cytochrome P450
MAFGHGIHFCIGAMLARTEAEIAIRTVLKRMPSIRFSEKPAEWDRDKRNGRMLKTLQVIL